MADARVSIPSGMRAGVSAGRATGSNRGECFGKATGSNTEFGMVSVETAISFFAVTVVVALMASVGVAGGTRLSLCQAVREGARVASVQGGDPAGAVTRSFPSASGISVTYQGDWVTVSAQAQLTLPGGFNVSAATCSATTVVETALVGQTSKGSTP